MRLIDRPVPEWFRPEALPKLEWDGKTPSLVCLEPVGYYLLLTPLTLRDLTPQHITSAQLFGRLGNWALQPAYGSIIIVPQSEADEYRYYGKQLVAYIAPAQPNANTGAP